MGDADPSSIYRKARNALRRPLKPGIRLTNASIFFLLVSGSRLWKPRSGTFGAPGAGFEYVPLSSYPSTISPASGITFAIWRKQNSGELTKNLSSMRMKEPSGAFPVKTCCFIFVDAQRVPAFPNIICSGNLSPESLACSFVGGLSGSAPLYRLLAPEGGSARQVRQYSKAD